MKTSVETPEMRIVQKHGLRRVQLSVLVPRNPAWINSSFDFWSLWAFSSWPKSNADRVSRSYPPISWVVSEPKKSPEPSFNLAVYHANNQTSPHMRKLCTLLSRARFESRT